MTGCGLSTPETTKGAHMKNHLRIALAAVALGMTVMAGSVSAAHPEPTTKADCMNGGFAEYKTSGRPDATQRFANQGQCIQFVNTGK